MDFHEFGHVAKIGNQRHLGALTAKGEANGVDGIVGDRESVHFDVSDHKALAGVNGFNAYDAFAKSFGQAAAQRIERRLGNVQRSFPEGQHLRQTVAMIRVFVGDKDTVEVIDGHFNGGESRKSFALT